MRKRCVIQDFFAAEAQRHGEIYSVPPCLRGKKTKQKKERLTELPFEFVFEKESGSF